MADKKYPVPYYKIGESPRYAHTRKDEEALQYDGWSETYIHQEFPKALYAKNGSVVRADDAAHEQRLLEEGYSNKPIAPQSERKAMAAEAAESTGRLDALEDRVQALEEQIEELLTQPKILIEDEPSRKGKRRSEVA